MPSAVETPPENRSYKVIMASDGIPIRRVLAPLVRKLQKICLSMIAEALAWTCVGQIDFSHAVLHVRRAKQGAPATHPIIGDEMRALRKLQREQEPNSPFVFTSERNSPFSTGGFARMMERAGVEAKLGFKAHPHMLRHACGFALANKGHDTRALQAYLGHRNIQHTVRYTELSPTRFKNFWRD